jgi:hypothetical protein
MTSGAEGLPVFVPPTFARLVVLDPLTGEQLAHRDLPTTAELGTLDGLAVVAWQREDSHLVVTGTAPITGEEQWRFESADVLAAALTDMFARFKPTELGLDVIADHVVVTAASGEIWILSRAGDLLRAVPATGERLQVQSRDRVGSHSSTPCRPQRPRCC